MEIKPDIKLIVNNQPRSWGNNENSWRKAILDKCNENSCKKIISDAKLKIEIIFYINKRRINRNDLDNLVKPVLDTLCKVNNPQTKDKLSGGIFNYDDNRVKELITKKEERNDEGALIRIWKLDSIKINKDLRKS